MGLADMQIESSRRHLGCETLRVFHCISRRSPDPPISLMLSGKSYLTSAETTLNSATTISASTASFSVESGRKAQFSVTWPLRPAHCRRTSPSNPVAMQHRGQHTTTNNSRGGSSVLPPINTNKTRPFKRQPGGRGPETAATLHLPRIVSPEGDKKFQYSARLVLTGGGSGGQTAEVSGSSPVTKVSHLDLAGSVQYVK